MEGTILALEPNKMIRYSFTMSQDLVTLTLDEGNRQTVLSVTHGDVVKRPDGEECYIGAVAGWDMNLPKIKEMAEKLK